MHRMNLAAYVGHIVALRDDLPRTYAVLVGVEPGARACGTRL